MNEISLMAILLWEKKKGRLFHVALFVLVILLSISIPVFVTSKSLIYITPNEVALYQPKAPQISDHNHPAEVPSDDPLYENIENGNIVPSDDNKFTIYVNYDFIKGGKSSKSSVRLLEPDVEFTQTNAKVRENDDECDDEATVSSDNDDKDGENNSKTMSKMIQCQQISMYIGEKKNGFHENFFHNLIRLAQKGISSAYWS